MFHVLGPPKDRHGRQCDQDPESGLDKRDLGIYHLIDTILRQEEDSHVQTAKVFQNGRSQAIRLPKQFRVNSAEVYLKATPEGFLVIPRDPWEVFAEGVQELSDDFMAAGRQQPKLQRRSWRW